MKLKNLILGVLTLFIIMGIGFSDSICNHINCEKTFYDLKQLETTIGNNMHGKYNDIISDRTYNYQELTLNTALSVDTGTNYIYNCNGHSLALSGYTDGMVIVYNCSGLTFSNFRANKLVVFDSKNIKVQDSIRIYDPNVDNTNTYILFYNNTNLDLYLTDLNTYRKALLYLVKNYNVSFDVSDGYNNQGHDNWDSIFYIFYNTFTKFRLRTEENFWNRFIVANYFLSKPEIWYNRLSSRDYYEYVLNYVYDINLKHKINKQGVYGNAYVYEGDCEDLNGDYICDNVDEIDRIQSDITGNIPSNYVPDNHPMSWYYTDITQDNCLNFYNSYSINYFYSLNISEKDSWANGITNTSDALLNKICLKTDEKYTNITINKDYLSSKLVNTRILMIKKANNININFLDDSLTPFYIVSEPVDYSDNKAMINNLYISSDKQTIVSLLGLNVNNLTVNETNALSLLINTIEENTTYEIEPNDQNDEFYPTDALHSIIYKLNIINPSFINKFNRLYGTTLYIYDHTNGNDNKQTGIEISNSYLGNTYGINTLGNCIIWKDDTNTIGTAYTAYFNLNNTICNANLIYYEGALFPSTTIGLNNSYYQRNLGYSFVKVEGSNSFVLGNTSSSSVNTINCDNALDGYLQISSNDSGIILTNKLNNVKLPYLIDGSDKIEYLDTFQSLTINLQVSTNNSSISINPSVNDVSGNDGTNLPTIQQPLPPDLQNIHLTNEVINKLLYFGIMYMPLIMFAFLGARYGGLAGMIFGCLMGSFMEWVIGVMSFSIFILIVIAAIIAWLFKSQINNMMPSNQNI